MPSTASPLLKLELQATGENNNTWGDIANTVFDLIETAIAGMTSVALTTGDTTLTDTQYVANESRSAMLKATGALSGNCNIIVPTRTKIYMVSNETSNAYTVTVKTAAGSGIAVTQGKKALVYCDGTNVVKFMATDDYVVPGDLASYLKLDGTTPMTAGLPFEGATGDAYETTLTVTDPTADRTITMPDATGTVPLLESDQGWSGAQRGTVATITYGTTTTLDFSQGNNLRVTLTGNITTLAASNMVDGQSGIITFVQDGTGSRTLTGVSSDFLGTDPTLSTAASARDHLPYYIENSKVIMGTLIANPS